MGNNSNEHNLQIHMIPVLIVNIKVEKGVQIGFFLFFPKHQNHLREPLAILVYNSCEQEISHQKTTNPSRLPTEISIHENSLSYLISLSQVMNF